MFYFSDRKLFKHLKSCCSSILLKHDTRNFLTLWAQMSEMLHAFLIIKFSMSFVDKSFFFGSKAVSELQSHLEIYFKRAGIQ